MAARCLDAISSWWVNLFGHANPRINAAIIDQLGKFEHVVLAGFTHEPIVTLSERLVALPCPHAAARPFCGSQPYPAFTRNQQRVLGQRPRV
jgi:adenosylmethionine-8-amino-7-oxononanoate aminotransferase